MQSLLRIAVWLMPTLAFAQTTDGIDRNLLERQQREIRFGVSLRDDQPLPGTASAISKITMPITLLPPGLNPLGEPARPAQPAVVPAPAQRTDTQDLERLHASQQRRQDQLQLQTRELPEPARRQESNAQQLIFERENRAQELGAEIMRRSNAATGAR